MSKIHELISGISSFLVQGSFLTVDYMSGAIYLSIALGIICLFFSRNLLYSMVFFFGIPFLALAVPIILYLGLFLIPTIALLLGVFWVFSKIFNLVSHKAS